MHICAAILASFVIFTATAPQASATVVRNVDHANQVTLSPAQAPEAQYLEERQDDPVEFATSSSEIWQTVVIDSAENRLSSDLSMFSNLRLDNTIPEPGSLDLLILAIFAMALATAKPWPRLRSYWIPKFLKFIHA